MTKFIKKRREGWDEHVESANNTHVVKVAKGLKL